LELSLRQPQPSSLVPREKWGVEEVERVAGREEVLAQTDESLTGLDVRYVNKS
jgi:hypothetical protein